MRFIDWDEVHRLADYSSVIDAIARMYASGCDAMDRMIMCQPTADGDEGDFLMQPAWMRGKAFGIKIANVFPANERRGKPSISRRLCLVRRQFRRTSSLHRWTGGDNDQNGLQFCRRQPLARPG